MHRGHQFLVGQVLQPQIQAQRDILTRTRRFDQFNVLNHPAQQVPDHFLAARRAGELFVEGQFHAFLTLFINVGEPDHMAGHFTGRVITAVLGQRVDTRHAQGQYGFRLLRRQPPGQINELPAGVRLHAPGETRPVNNRVAGQLGPLLLILHRLLGIRPQRHHRSTDRQRPAIAVANHTPVGGQRLHPQITDIPLVGQEIVLDHLQIHRAHHQHTGAHQPKRQHQVPASAGPAFAGDRFACRFAFVGAHGRVNTRSSVVGTFMPSFSLARLSTRA